MTIEDLLRAHKNMAFPDFGENDELAKWIEDLAEKEGHYIGLVKSNKISSADLTHFQDFARQLENIYVSSTDEVAHLQYCKRYAFCLEKVIKAAVS